MDKIKRNIIDEIKINMETTRIKETYLLGKYYFFMIGIISFIMNVFILGDNKSAFPYFLVTLSIGVPCFLKEIRPKFIRRSLTCCDVRKNLMLLIKLMIFNFFILICVRNLYANNSQIIVINHAITSILVAIIMLLTKYFLLYKLNETESFDKEKRKLNNEIYNKILFVQMCFKEEFDRFYRNQIYKIEEIEDEKYKIEYLNLAQFMNYVKTLRLNEILKAIDIQDIEKFQLTSDTLELKKVTFLFNELRKAMEIYELALKINYKDLKE